VLFRYLQNIGNKELQVFISSHSPTITAKTDVDSLIVLNQSNGTVTATPIADLALAPKNKGYLRRFLDITKCQLFFANAVVLVEGISEALLLPSFGRAMGPDCDLDRNGVEVVNIGGVAFEPFAQLFNATDANKRVNTRCAILTDDDAGDAGTISARARAAEGLASGLLKVLLARKTFEYELYLVNEALVLETYRSLHPRTDLTFTGSLEDRARQFAFKVEANEDKAILAQELTWRIGEENLTPQVPPYIQKAIRWALRGEWVT
jgi:putative ATP-dependent endonuclease of OLD family